MLNIVVINCDGKYVEYEWDSKLVEMFLELCKEARTK